MQQKVRKILRPPTEGTHFTMAEARAAYLAMRKEREALAKQKTHKRKRTAKAE